ncbi:MAG: hypothetical protein AAGE59_12070 [Cyanobacteria bacterium P01_F01_bin.86]
MDAFFSLRLQLDIDNAVAIALADVSIRAVTFVTSPSFLTQLDLDSGGHMVEASTLLELKANS